MSEILLQLDFGFYAFEKVWSVKQWKKKPMVICSMEPRHPLDIVQADYDDHGRFEGFEMWGNPYDAEVLWMPGYKLVVFTNGVFDLLHPGHVGVAEVPLVGEAYRAVAARRRRARAGKRTHGLQTLTEEPPARGRDEHLSRSEAIEVSCHPKMEGTHVQAKRGVSC